MKTKYLADILLFNKCPNSKASKDMAAWLGVTNRSGRSHSDCVVWLAVNPK